jgi:hypothetical protein
MSQTGGATLAVLDYPEIRRRCAQLRVRQDEVPVEHHVSPPLPTLRGGEPAYACFAAPAARAPGAPLRVGSPDRWWVVRATDLRLVTYALVASIPFASTPLPGPVLVPPSGRSMRDLRADEELLDGLMTAAATRFFAGDPPGDALAEDLAGALATLVPGVLLPWHRALTPDFFAWLEGA